MSGSGPDLFVFIDDHELLATPSGNPLTPLADLIPQARDIGLHIVLARSTHGAGRSLYDPIIQRLKDSASPALVMSGDTDAGGLFGDERPGPLPPGRGVHVSRSGPRLIQTALART
jgi:DNA segregation ATPase FtsK/SpoIIIE, S-DNA-T family